MPFLGPYGLAAAMLLGSHVQTAAYDSEPIRITKCTLEEIFIPVSNGDVFLEQSAGSQLHIRFTNTSTDTIASVAFNVTIDGKDRTIVDAGTFTQGALIDHYFAQADMQGGDATCHAVSVRLKDGGV